MGRRWGACGAMFSVVAAVWPWLACPAAPAARLPPGHRDFVPTAPRPVGWRGDGTGAFPGATPKGQIERTLGGFVRRLGAEWIQRQCKIFGVVHWDAWMGWTSATTASDGERVYAWMGQNQVVCYDLDGNRV